MNKIWEISNSYRSSIIAASEFEKVTYIIDFEKEKKICQFNSTYGFGAKRLAITSDGKLVATGSYEGKGLALYNSNDGSEIWKRKDLSKIQVVKISPDDKYIFVSVDSKYLLQIDLESGTTLNKLKDYEDIYFSLFDNTEILESKKYSDYYAYSNGKELSIINKESSSSLDICFTIDTVFISEVCRNIRAINFFNGEEIWKYKPDEGSHFLKLQYNKELDVLFGILKNYKKHVSECLFSFDTNYGKIINKYNLKEQSFVYDFDILGRFLYVNDGYDILRYVLNKDLKNMKITKVKID